MKGYFRIVKTKTNTTNSEFVNHGTGRNNKDTVKKAEGLINQKFVYNGYIGNIIIYTTEVIEGYYYTLQIDRN